MIFLGTLSLLQILFLPGFLVLLLLQMNKGALRTMLFSIGLSLLINYILIFSLVIFGLYQRNIFFFIVILEMALLVRWFVRHPQNFSFLEKLNTVRSQCAFFIKSQSLVSVIIFIVACAAILFYLFYLIGYFRPVFAATDPLLGWNAWAILWYEGAKHFIVNSYPQLLPMMWSLNYLFIDSSYVQLFNQLMMVVFPFSFLLLFGELFSLHKNRSYLLALILAGYVLFAFLNWRVFSGFADLSSMFFGMLSLTILFFPFERYTKKQCIKLIIFGALFASGSALTKRSGLLYAIAYPILLFFYMPWKKTNFKFKEQIVLCLYSAGIILVLVGLSYWYLTNGLTGGAQIYGHFFSGPDTSIAYFLLSYPQRWIYSLILLRGAIGSFNLYLLFPLILILGLIRKPTLIWLFIWACCFYLVWAFFFSYDLRNVILTIPAFAIIAGIGLDALIEYVKKYGLLVLKRTRLMVLLLIAIFAILGLYNAQINKSIMQQQVSFKAKLGIQSVNIFLYDYFRDHPTRGKILSNYFMLRYLPGFSQAAENLSLDKKVLSQQLDDIKPTYIFISKVLFAETFHGKECAAPKGQLSVGQVNHCNYTDIRDFKRLHLGGLLDSYKAVFKRHHYKVVVDNDIVLLMKI